MPIHVGLCRGTSFSWCCNMQILSCPLREHLSPPPMKGETAVRVGKGVFVKLTVLCNNHGRDFFLLPPPAVLPPFLPPAFPPSLRSGLSLFKIVAGCGAGARVDPETWYRTGASGELYWEWAGTQHEREERLFSRLSERNSSIMISAMFFLRTIFQVSFDFSVLADGNLNLFQLFFSFL